ncbi:MAG: nucleotidyltransferase domain-containing protein [Candidatus Nanoarchaeia archaeon]
MVNTTKLKLTILQQEILRYLFIKTGTSFNALHLAKALHVSQPAISKALPNLEKNNLINVEKDKESKRLKIELNRENPKIIWLKRIDNLKQIYESGLVEYLYEQYPSAAIILFGSYSFGEDTLTSDIDLAIVGSKEKNINLTDYEKVLQRKININYYTSLKEIDNNLKTNILRGITLKGWIEL